LKRILKLAVVFVAATFVLMQLVPFGRDHTTPPVTAEPAWDSPRTRQLAMDSCGSCHSNETEWPWYSNVAPMSWLVQRDVEEGRAVLNFSEWDREQEEANDAAETIEEDEMPPFSYLLIHPDARLSDAEAQRLMEGLEATFGAEDNSGPGS
jgi:mono/diheme cytochrome c family protein